MNAGDAVKRIGSVKDRRSVLLISALMLIPCGLSEWNIIGNLPDHLAHLIWIPIVLCGVPIIAEAAYALVTEFDVKADLLVSVAIAASVAVGELFAAGTVAVIMCIGSYLEEYTVAKARRGIENLSKLSPVTAHIENGDGSLSTVPAKDVEIGDRVRVLAGETIPVDGIIVSGSASVDESVLTGESLPADRSAGDRVKGGTVSRFGSFIMTAEKVGEGTSIGRMIRLVNSVNPGKAKIVREADRWATWIVATAFAAAIGVCLATGDVIRSVTVLVVFCPCAFVLATPTAIMAAVGNASRRGVLVRQGDAMERMAEIDTVAFDKTGTITTGNLEVSAVHSFGSHTEEDILRIAASAESMSEHPMGKCICRKYGRVPEKPEDFELVPGRGVKASVGGRRIAIGSLAFMMESGADVTSGLAETEKEYSEGGSAAVFLAEGNAVIGSVVMRDSVRADSCPAIARVRAEGVRTVIITGDSAGAAERVGKAVGADRIFSGCLPEDKLRIISEMQKAGHSVCMIGDGVNDAAALRAADVGIAMGLGSDVAMESSDIVLSKDGLGELPYIIGLSRRTMSTIRINLTVSAAINGTATILAMLGLIDPIAGSIVHNGGSVFVIGMSALLLTWHDRNIPRPAPRAGPDAEPGSAKEVFQ